MKFLKISIKSGIKTLSEFFSKNKNHLAVIKNKLIDKYKGNKSSKLTDKFRSFYNIIKNIKENKADIDINYIIHNNSFNIKDYKTINQSNFNNQINIIDEEKENESYIYNKNKTDNIISKDKNYFNFFKLIYSLINSNLFLIS